MVAACNKMICMHVQFVVALLLLVASKCWCFVKDATQQEEDGNTCTLYLAESSVQGVNGKGIFTAKAFKMGSIISPPDSPSIPVCSPWPKSGLINHYWWSEGSGTSDDMSFECSEWVVDYFVMFGALPNYHTYLMNFIIHQEDVPYDDSMVETTANPGAGAFSYHGGRIIEVSVDIEAGDELFLNYGLDYQEDADFSGHWFEYVPRSADFQLGGIIMEECLEHLDAIITAVKDQATAEEVLEHTLAAIRKTAAESNERVASILPKTVSELDGVIRRSRVTDLSEALAKEVSVKKRSVEWLVENGRCVDNIRPGRSNLPFAGRGAIAQRFIGGGEIVVPVPLIQIMNTDLLTLWKKVQNDKGGWDKVPVGKQLLLNYCFGHDESSLLLCPITNAILINHCSNRTKECGKDGPNAEFRWDTEFDKDTKRWLEMTFEEMEEEEGRGLSFEIVATRDIQPGEEIFMDYGPSWEEAWNQHVEAWNPEDNVPLDSVKLLNDEMGPVKIMSGDLRNLADHPTITTGCVYWDVFEGDVEGYSEYRGDGWHELSDETVLLYFSEDGSQFTPERSPRRYSFGGAYWPCSVVREEKDGGYLVQVFPKPKARTDPPIWHEKGLPHFLTHYPRRSIRYFTRPDRSDMHRDNAFRHHINIPDEIFPSHWKDRRQTGRDEL